MSLLQAMFSVLLDLAPFLLLGAAVAGLLYVLLPDGFVQSHLRRGSGVIKAVLLGIPLPLCSCGVIPTGLGLRKSGASRGAAVGFLISTPQTGVDSILVSAAFLGWPFAVFKVVAAAVTGLVGGLLTDAVSPGTVIDGPVAAETSTPRHGWREGVEHALDILRTIWRWIVVGVVVSAVITTLVPPGVFRAAAGHGQLVSALLVLLVSVPLYVCATASVPIAAALVAGGFPPGAALVFLMAGPATNVATIGAIGRSLGARALAIYLATITAGSVGLGMAFDFLIESVPATISHSHESMTWWKLASAVVLLALLVRFALEDLRGFVRRRSRAGVLDGDAVVEVGVDGMTCSGCVSKLESALRGEQGVRAVRVSLESKRAVVTGSLGEARVREVIESSGFRPTPN